MRRHQSKRQSWLKPMLLLPVLGLLVLAFAKPQGRNSEPIDTKTALSALPFTAPVASQQDVQDVDKKKIEDYKKKITLLKEKYTELEKKKKSADSEGVASIEKEQAMIKKKIGAINMELEKLVGPDVKKQEALKKKQMQKEEEAKKEAEKKTGDEKGIRM